jgi:hypothetical protein
MTFSPASLSGRPFDATRLFFADLFFPMDHPNARELSPANLTFSNTWKTKY